MQTACERGVTTVYLDRSAGYVDFNDLEAFAFYDGHIELAGELLPVPGGQIAAINIIGKPNTEYHLSVILASGESSAAGLGLTTSGEDGFAGWTWRIASQVRPGMYNAVIIGGGDRLVLEIEVY
jgi:hypothetical protein